MNLNKSKSMDGEERFDHISSLPDEILCLITSKLSFKSVVKTTLLSKRWKELWKMGLVGEGSLEDAFKAVSNFHKDFDELHRSKNIRGFLFSFGQGNILLASVSPYSNKLHLDFSTGKQQLPGQFGWLLDLRSEKLTHHPSPSPSTFYVKALYLISISCEAKEGVSSLLLDFPFLESLTIAKCNGLKSLWIDATSRLRNLTVLDCPKLKSLFIYKASELRSFRYRGLLPCFHVDLVLYLKDAMLDFRKGLGYGFKNYFFASVLEGIQTAMALTLCRWTFEELIYPFLSLDSNDSNFDDLMELWWIDYEEDGQYNSDALISFLKFCPHLKTLSVTIDAKSDIVPRTKKMPSSGVTRNTKLEYLKAVKLDRFTNQKNEISLAKQLKEVFNVEPRIVAKSNGANSWRSLVKVYNWQEENFFYKFVEESRHINWLCSKHPHMDL